MSHDAHVCTAVKKHIVFLDHQRFAAVGQWYRSLDLLALWTTVGPHALPLPKARFGYQLSSVFGPDAPHGLPRGSWLRRAGTTLATQVLERALACGKPRSLRADGSSSAVAGANAHRDRNFDVQLRRVCSLTVPWEADRCCVPTGRLVGLSLCGCLPPPCPHTPCVNVVRSTNPPAP